MSGVTATELRQDVYALLDKVIETGEPIEVIRKGISLTIMLKPKASKLEAAEQAGKQVWIGDRNDIFRIDYLSDWRQEWQLEPPTTKQD